MRTKIMKKLISENLEQYWSVVRADSIQKIISAQKGERNMILNRTVFRMGQVYQGLRNIGYKPEPNESSIKPEIYNAINNQVNPLLEFEYFPLVIRSFRQGMAQPLNLEHLIEKTNKKKSKSKIRRKEERKEQKIQIRWLTNSDKWRFSFLPQKDVKCRKPTQSDVDQFNEICGKVFTLEGLNRLGILIYNERESI